ncbi:MAG TPA: alpha-1,4-glucan--maltose-1-phosphate maltosyltransferase [Thermoanaerobaculia bacterium]|nr:alpha-1,4-glucan--maltose-1-phosphate maltosyltransferase [Thermoanaerobaculia bacterium]
MTKPTEGRRRVIIEGVEPQVDSGRFPAKRVVGDRVTVEADIFTDGHDRISAVLLFQKEGEEGWNEVPMVPLDNDRWEGSFALKELGRCVFTIEAWVDHYLTWHGDLKKRVAAGQDVTLQLVIGARLIASAASRAKGSDRASLLEAAKLLESDASVESRLERVFREDLLALMTRNADRSLATRFSRDLTIVADPPRARYSTWYEMFPRSAGAPGTHGTFRDVEARLSYVAGMGFDVLYLPPIHPIGMAFRKGKNNATTSQPGEPGSPWAIGGADGGHTAIHAELGTMDDFSHLVRAAAERGMDVALDIAFQLSPDHPWVKEHPEWFLMRPDGTIQYAENPPKKYEDIYPFNFETEDWEELWESLRDVFLFWVDKGVRIFRVDNPHTKALPFWEWAIGAIKAKHPETIFLAEAFTRPKVMYYLAKAGFTQSYTYFAWRNAKWDLTEYFTELNEPPVRDFFRPNVWPNTPDILTEQLQYGGRPAFTCRLVLAGTLAASYGIYGPAYEMGDHLARQHGSEEYLDSEKYEIRHWDLDNPDSLRDFITRVNRIRRQNPALQSDHSLRFHKTSNEQILCYSKNTEDHANVIVTFVNLDFHNTQAGFADLDLEAFGLRPDQTFQVHDLLSDARYTWHGPRTFVELNPHIVPAHIFSIQRERRTEKDYDATI